MKKINLYVIILVCTILMIDSCGKRIYRSDYITSIQYLDSDSIHEIDLRNGIVALDFLNGFNNDSLIVRVNNSIIFKETIMTNDVTGNALTLRIDSLKNVKEVSIQLNSGAKAIVTCDKNNQLFIIKFSPDSLFIIGTTFFPAHL